jgi:hypothetical protein
MLGRCSEHGLPCTRAELGTHSDNFRGDFAAFRRMGALKARGHGGCMPLAVQCA